MPLSMRVDVLSIDAVLYAGEARMVIVPGDSGELGIYPRHAPLFTRIRPGVVTIVDARMGKPLRLLVAGGVFEVAREGVTLIADHALRTPELDAMRAGAARRAADEWRKHYAQEVRRPFDVAAAKTELIDEIRRFFALAMHRETARDGVDAAR